MSQRRRLSFWPGETVRVRVAFSDEAGAGVTVGGVVFSARDPAGAAVSLTPTSESASTYFADVPVTMAGDWAVRATCAVPTPAAVEVSFSVVPSHVI
jgi:hypothetical protein